MNKIHKLALLGLIAVLPLFQTGCAAMAVGAVAGAGGYELFQQHQKNKEQDAQIADLKTNDRVQNKALDRHERGLNYLYTEGAYEEPKQGSYQPPTCDWMKNLD